MASKVLYAKKNWGNAYFICPFVPQGRGYVVHLAQEISYLLLLYEKVFPSLCSPIVFLGQVERELGCC